MMKRVCAVTATVVTLMSTTIIEAHANESADPSWTMPNLRGMTLQQATDAVIELTGNKKQKFRAQDIRDWNRDVLTPTLWDVCWHSPRADAPITKKQRVVFGVIRRGDSCKAK